MTGYPRWVVEVGFGGEPGAEYLILGDDPRGKLGTGRLAPDAAGTDVSADVDGVSSRRGRSRPFGSFTAGSATVRLKDQHGDYNPTNLAGRFVAAGATQVRPMVRVALMVEYPSGSGTRYPVNVVWAEKWTPSWTLGEAYVTMIGADAFKSLARAAPAGPSVPAGAGETTGARIARRLNDHGWPAGARDIDAGKSTVQATTRSQSPLADMQDAETAEAGYLFMGRDGKVVFRDRHSRFEDVVSATVQATFGEDIDAGELHYDGIVPANDDAQIINSVTVQIDGGVEQHVEDQDSIGRYLERTSNTSGLILETDGEAAQWGEFLLGRFADFDARIDQLHFDLVPGDYRFAVLLGLDIGHRIAVVRRTPDGATITREAFVEAIEWAGSSASWTCDLSLSSAETFTGFVLGSTELGDTAAPLVAY